MSDVEQGELCAFKQLSEQDKERLRMYMDANSKDDLIEMYLEYQTADQLKADLDHIAQVENDNDDV